MQKILIGILGSLSLILITILMIESAILDKEGPRIEYSERQLIYEDDIDMSDFITDVIATDAKEGDVSSTVIIDRVIKMKSVNVAVIIYAAKDSSNNITQKERMVRYIPDEADDAKESLSSSENQMDSESYIEPYIESTIESSRNGFFNRTSDDTSISVIREQGVEADTEIAQPEETEEIQPEETDEIQPEETQPVETQPEETVTPDTEGQDNNVLSIEEARASALETRNPYIRLNTYSARLKVGDTFNYAEYIEYAVDDLDDVYRSIIVSRDYNTDEPGIYEISFYVTDSDGNRSNIEVLNLTVEE